MTDSDITRVRLAWNQIDDVLLDMDGTLLDRHFDDHFFETELPKRYAAKHQMSFQDAQRELIVRYKSVRDRLEWADPHFWTRELDIDLIGLNEELAPLIRFHADAEVFLQFLQQEGKRAVIVTNSHDEGLKIKIARTGIDRCVDRIINAFEIGSLKLHEAFWTGAQEILKFHPLRTLYIDDDEACLAAAHRYGIQHVVHRCTSSSQIEPRPSAEFPSIFSFQELLRDSLTTPSPD